MDAKNPNHPMWSRVCHVQQCYTVPRDHRRKAFNSPAVSKTDMVVSLFYITGLVLGHCGWLKVFRKMEMFHISKLSDICGLAVQLSYEPFQRSNCSLCDVHVTER